MPRQKPIPRKFGKKTMDEFNKKTDKTISTRDHEIKSVR